MLKRIGLPLLGLALMLMFVVPSHANAKVHFGIFVGPTYPAYPYAYSYPYSNPYYYNPYYYPYDYYPYAYSYPYGYRVYGGYWGGHRDWDDYYHGGHGEHGFRGGEHAYSGRGHGYGREREHH